MSSLRKNNVTIFGNGPKAMVFAHGYGCDQSVWEKMLPDFKDDYTCIKFDHMGFGSSDLSAFCPLKYSSFQGFSSDLISILDELEVKESILVGHSFSGMIGMLAGIERPDLFSAQIMIAPSPCYLNDTLYSGGLNLADVMGILAQIEKHFNEWAIGMSKLAVGNNEHPEFADSLAKLFSQQDPKIMRHFAEIIFLSDFRNELSSAEIPSLILQCAEDPIAPAVVGHYLSVHLKNCQITHLKCTGHYPHMVSPQETSHEIKKFIKEYGRRKTNAAA